ncbi:MAG TPA: glutathione S-transferase family protein [Bordetella sp.]|uniref:glutathione S-transferase family protein n=1 Tax=Bordetella sp. TaxID=28081 RepID=UPI002ED33A11
MYTLIIANKNYSSWSLRAWLALREAGIAFEEKRLNLDTPEFASQLQKLTPAGKVPCLIDDGFSVWDSLAICEYAAERHPEAGLWPADPRARARARSLAAQMHSGFGDLRRVMPMNIEAHLPGIDVTEARQDIDKVQALWRDTRAEFGHGGPFLFGRFSVADAFYAPIVSRFTTYGVTAEGAAREYMDAILAVPGMQEWTRDALAEGLWVAQDEPYRTQR